MQRSISLELNEFLYPPNRWDIPPWVTPSLWNRTIFCTRQTVGASPRRCPHLSGTERFLYPPNRWDIPPWVPSSLWNRTIFCTRQTVGASPRGCPLYTQVISPCAGNLPMRRCSSAHGCTNPYAGFPLWVAEAGHPRGGAPSGGGGL